MRTEVGLISGWGDWLLCAAIIVVACAGKFGGTTLSARLTGLGWRDASALGVLMNTRGLVELIVLNIGLDLHVITPQLFTILVIMACVTTFMTAPLLEVLLRRHPWVEIDVEAGRRPSERTEIL
jgi:Kef-type K+ transport system membrane component KefB